MTTTAEAIAASFADSVMRGVVAAAADSVRQDIDRAIRIMRAECKAFLFGDEYADERDCVMRGSVSQRYAIASVVASCVEKIRAA